MVMDPYVAVHFQHIFVANSIEFHRVVTPVNNEVLSFDMQIWLSSPFEWLEASECDNI